MLNDMTKFSAKLLVGSSICIELPACNKLTINPKKRFFIFPTYFLVGESVESESDADQKWLVDKYKCVHTFTDKTLYIVITNHHNYAIDLDIEMTPIE